MKTTIKFLLCFTFCSTVLLHAQQRVTVSKNDATIGWIGKKVLGEHNGNIQLKSGSFEWDGEHIIGGEFVIDMTTITCNDLEGEWNDKLVGHLKSDDFFGVSNFNEATFKMNAVTASSIKNQYAVKGDLTIKGKTHPIAFSAEIDHHDTEVHANAMLRINRTQYGIKYGSNSFFDDLGDKAIEDFFILNISFTAKVK